MSNKLPTREELIDAGYEPSGIIYISPISGELLSFDQARQEYAYND